MADITPIKPIKLCVNITIPTIDDDSISLYECVGILGNKLQEAIQKINDSFGSLEGAYTAANPPPYPVTSVNGKKGAVVIDIPANVYTQDNPPPYPVTSVNRAETKDVITVFEPEGGGIEDVSQAELIAACKAGARLGAFNQDDGTCRLYHFNLYIDPERVNYSEVAGGGASGVASVNDQTGAVNIFNAPISAATADSVENLAKSTDEKIRQLKADLGLELLWTNASPTSQFEPQTINLSLTDYKYLFVLTELANTVFTTACNIVLINDAKYCLYGGNSTDDGGAVFRFVTASSTGLTFYDGGYLNTTGYSINTNTLCIPIKIYGVK